MDKNKILEAAAKLVAKGAYDKAIKEYQKVLDADPKDVRVLQKMGELYQKKNDNPQAAHYFTKVAESYASDGFFLKAVALYKQVLKLNPNLLEVNLKLAELHQQLGLMGEAMTYFQIVANAYDKAGDIKNSLDTLRRMVDLDPDNVASRIKLAELYAREGMVNEATQEFKRSAEYLKRNNRTDDWLRVAERLITLEPDSIPLNKELAGVYTGRGDHKRALARLQVCFKADSKDVETLNMLAQAFQGLGQTAKTISVYKELAKLYQDRSRPQEANGVWERVAQLDPNDPELLARRSMPAAPAPAPQPAPAAAAPAPLHTPAPMPAAAAPAPAPQPTPEVGASSSNVPKDQLSKLLTETDVYVKYGLHDKALEHLRKIFALDPENLDAHEKAYHIYVASSNPAQASEQLLNVLRLCTRAAEVQRAQPYLATILQQNPGHPEVPAFLSVLRTEDTSAAFSAPPVEAVHEDAILVDSNEEEIFVADAPDDALSQAAGDELALASISMSSEEVVEEEGLVTSEVSVYEASVAEEQASAYAAEEFVAEESLLAEPEGESAAGDELAVYGEPLETMSSEEDEPLTLPPAAEAMGHEAPVALGDEDEPPPTRIASPSMQLFKEAFPDRQPPPGAPTDDAFARALAAAEAPEDATIRIPVSAQAPRSAGARPQAAAPRPAPTPPVPRAVASPPVPAAIKPAAPAAPVAPHVEEEEPAGEECEEASFFLDQGLYEEAREILETVLIAFPGHSRAGELMARLEELESGAAPAPQASAPGAVPSLPSVPSVKRLGEERDAFDLAAELAGELEELGSEEHTGPVSAADEDFQYSVEEVFAEFKKGLAKVVKPEDADTHYDLGIAYKEMGLVDDALHEFAVAREGCIGKKREVDCLMMMGLLQAQRGESAVAVDTFKQALASEHAAGEAGKALGYELATVYEALSELGKALYHYQRVAHQDARYREVSSHVQRLAAATMPEEDPLPGPRRMSSGASSAESRAAAAAPPSAPGAPKARKVGYV